MKMRAKYVFSNNIPYFRLSLVKEKSVADSYLEDLMRIVPDEGIKTLCVFLMETYSLKGAPFTTKNWEEMCEIYGRVTFQIQFFITHSESRQLKFIDAFEKFQNHNFQDKNQSCRIKRSYIHTPSNIYEKEKLVDYSF